MNRNNERHFLQIPEMHASRTRFNRDQTILTTFDSGKLIPFFVDEVLPGDTFQVDTAAIIRMTTPKYPVMDDAFIDFYYFYCPNRILWDDFKAFMGEVEEDPWMPTKTYKVPQLEIKNRQKQIIPYEGSILDYMGVPTKCISAPEEKTSINALPIRAYVKIWNEFFRDENVDNAATITTKSEDVEYKDQALEEQLELTLQQAYKGGRCLPVNKFHDYFTSCLPYPQRGPNVTLPLTGNAKIEWSFSAEELQEYGIMTSNGAQHLIPASGNTLGAPKTNEDNGKPKVLLGKDSQGVSMWVPMEARLDNATSATINQLRQAISVQQYYEALARGGSRYREQVRALWGVSIRCL
jgi:hypothetical protein